MSKIDRTNANFQLLFYITVTASVSIKNIPMLALKKKREAEAKAKQAEESAAAKAAAVIGTTSPSTEPGSSNNTNSKVSLLGIGGKTLSKNTSNGSSSRGGKKRTPGEIRIQKGMFHIVCKTHYMYSTSYHLLKT